MKFNIYHDWLFLTDLFKQTKANSGEPGKTEAHVGLCSQEKEGRKAYSIFICNIRVQTERLQIQPMKLEGAWRERVALDNPGQIHFTSPLSTKYLF